MYFYSFKVSGDVIVDVANLESVDKVEEEVRSRLLYVFESLKGVKEYVVTGNEPVPTKRKGKKFKFKLMRLNENNDVEVYKFNVWYGKKNATEIRVKFTIRGPLSPDKDEVKQFAEMSGNKKILEKYGL